ncbi:unnamed protein product [Toxocara canis]|uniref:C2H2-type domain-containing protein n=1 Tax=Toxocara canis TaxID=6265 RepID=A0A183V3A7_TOXCA|nr:unnamed protein product [Toxocara canis]
MAEEFSHIYKTYGEHLNIKNYAMRNLAANAAQNSQEQVRRKLHFQPRSQEEASQSLPSLSAPPPAPDLTVTAVKTELRSKPARRIGLGDYKQLYVKEKRLLTPHPEEEMRQKRRGKGLERDSVKRRPPENADKLLSDEPSSQHQTRENERAAVNVEHEGTPSAPPSNHHRLLSSLSPGSQQSRRSSNEPEAALRSSCSSDLLVHGACSPGAVDPANFSTASSNHRMSMENGGRLSRSAGSSIYPRRPPRPHTSPSLQTPLNRAYPNLCTTPSPSNHNFACCSGNHGSRPGCRSPMAIKRRFMIFRRQADVRSHNRNGGGDCGSRGHRTWCPGAIGYRYNYRNDRHNSWNEPWRHSNHNYKSFQGGFQQCRFRSGIRWGRTNDTDSLKQAVDVSYNTSPPALPAAQPFVFEFSSASPSWEDSVTTMFTIIGRITMISKIASFYLQVLGFFLSQCLWRNLSGTMYSGMDIQAEQPSNQEKVDMDFWISFPLAAAYDNCDMLDNHRHLPTSGSARQGTERCLSCQFGHGKARCFPPARSALRPHAELEVIKEEKRVVKLPLNLKVMREVAVSSSQRVSSNGWSNDRRVKQTKMLPLKLSFLSMSDGPPLLFKHGSEREVVEFDNKETASTAVVASSCCAVQNEFFRGKLQTLCKVTSGTGLEDGESRSSGELLSVGSDPGSEVAEDQRNNCVMTSALLRASSLTEEQKSLFNAFC